MTSQPEGTLTASHWGTYRVSSSNGRVTAVQPFENDPEPSPMINAMPDVVHADCRVTQPMVRKGWLEDGFRSDTSGRGVEQFVAVSWDEAMDLVAAEINRVRTTYGNEAIFASSGWASAGTFHSATTQLKRFFNDVGGFVDQVTNYSFGSASVILPRVTGGMEPVMRPTSWPNIVENSKLLVAFGGISPKNSQVSKDGIARHETQDHVRDAYRAGVDLVQISPIRDDFTDEVDVDWIAPRPNTDTALMLGIAHTLVSEGLHDQQFLDRFCVGYDRFEPYLLGSTDGVAKNADWAADITGIEANRLRELARRMARTRTMITVSWSVQRCDHGEQPCWMAITLAAMLGQIGLPGGGVGIGYGSNATIGQQASRMPNFGLPQGGNAVSNYIPMARVVDMLLSPGLEYDFNGERLTYPDIRMVYWAGGNPFHKQQDINRFLKAWQRPESIIVHEPWWTPAARRADIVLPVTTTLERNDISAGLRDRFFVAMYQAVSPVGNARSDYDIFSGLAMRLGVFEEFTQGRDEMEWLRYMYGNAKKSAKKKNIDMPDFEVFWERGFWEFKTPEESSILFEGFRRDPNKMALKTPSGRIEIFSDTIDGFGYEDCPGHPTWLEPAEWLGSDKAEEYPLHLISNQPLRRMHSQLDFCEPSQGTKIAGREPVSIHPFDAAVRGISHGDVVRLFNSRGACLAGAEVKDSVRQGVVQLSTGAWLDPLDKTDIGSLEKHGNPNVLTIDKGSSRLAQSCMAQTALVEVEVYEGEVPPVTAFDTPDIADK
ncbi:MAG: Dimethyl sulfoxide/trimethylamine N-oxide reductase [Alphaproteobacteria bacterium MarineAlpha11_Bin1]|nr:MAG: Dimethyl sulfoxide/trimethylamine N-oxide reductase [Alphaproteobacteria bacterium MarineAlpha11_Bin1]